MTTLADDLKTALKDRYAIEREVGRGGMAVVFLARDRKLGRDVAIKVLSPDVLTAVAVERFLREARITARLQHPNILPLIDSGEAAGRLYSVMPFVEGETLRGRLLSGALAIPEALRLACEISDALNYAHERGIIHRDVKPENILLSNGHAVITDFGIARALGLTTGNSLTARGLPIGTAAYMSPEQAQGNGKGDARSDVYGMGCVLYEMLTGRMAFGGPNLREVLARQAAAEPEPITRFRPEVPAAVVAIVARALTKRAEDRYQTAGALANDLRIAIGEPTLEPAPARKADGAPAWEPPPDERAPAGSRSGQWLVVAAVAVLLLFVAIRFGAHRARDSGSAAAADTGGRTDGPERLDRQGAREAYVQGTRWLARRTPDGLRRAVEAFSRATAQDGQYAPALAGLASAHTWSVVYGYRGEADPYSELAQALLLADSAVRGDSSAAAGYLARADARSIAFFPDDSVRDDVLRARRLAPGAADVRRAYAWTLFRRGAPDSALAEARAAVAAAPGAVGLRHSLLALGLATHRYDLVLREVASAPAGGAADPVIQVFAAYAQLLSGRPAACASRSMGNWLAVRAMCLHQLGRSAEAAALTDSLGKELEQEHYRFLHEYADLAAYYAWRGNTARSVRWLERSATHSPMLHRWQLESGLFDRVRHQPEFEAGLVHARTLAEERLRARRAAIGN